jgi:hypothetical protein
MLSSVSSLVPIISQEAIARKEVITDAQANLALALAAGLLHSGTTAPVVYGSEPTPTPLQTNSQPGGSGGGG